MYELLALLQSLPPEIQAFLVVTGMVFVGEIGDKTMMVTLALVERHPRPAQIGQVLLGIIPACFIVPIAGMLVSVFGKYWISQYWVNTATGILLIYLCRWSILEIFETDDGDNAPKWWDRIPWLRSIIEGFSKWWRKRSLIGISFWLFTLAEMLDRTQVITITMTGGTAAWVMLFWEWLGSSLGLVFANLCAVALFLILRRLLPRQKLMYGAAILFLASGEWMLLWANSIPTGWLAFTVTCVLGLNPWAYRFTAKELKFPSGEEKLPDIPQINSTRT